MNQSHFVLTMALMFALGVVHAEDEEIKPCPPAEIKAARSFVPTAAQLKAYVDATVELQAAARKDPALAAAMSDEKDRAACRLDDQTTALSQAGARAILAGNPTAARIFASRGVSASDLGRWSFIVTPMALSLDPRFGSIAKEALSPQQAAFAKQQAAELQRLMKSMQSD